MILSRSSPTRRFWTPSEDAVLRARYPLDGIAIAVTLGRSADSVRYRLYRLRIVVRPDWSAGEKALLRNSWGEFTLRQLSRRLGRTQAGVYDQAKKLGLKVGRPGGFESLKSACRRSGCHDKTLLRVLRWYGVKIHRSLARPRRGVIWPQSYVDPYAVDAAIAAWCKSEPVRVAALRHGVGAETLRRWLTAARAAGDWSIPRRPAHKERWRVASETIDRIAAVELARFGKRRAA